MLVHTLNCVYLRSQTITIKWEIITPVTDTRGERVRTDFCTPTGWESLRAIPYITVWGEGAAREFFLDGWLVYSQNDKYTW